VLIAVSSEQATDAIVASLEMIGPLEASGALPRRCLLRDVWVAEAHRRRGLARRLMLAAEESVSSQGVWRRS
jgi:GNAT superfamily N-acetyltransferase